MAAPIVGGYDRLNSNEKLVERKGCKWVKCSHDSIAKVCVYYKNAREKLRTFLDYEDIPLFTNKVENAIRPITILRKNCLFQHSPKYMEGMCMAYSTWRLSKIIRSRDRRSG